MAADDAYVEALLTRMHAIGSANDLGLSDAASAGSAATLYLGNQNAAGCFPDERDDRLADLRAAGITRVLTCAHNTAFAVFEGDGIGYKRLMIRDVPEFDIRPFFDEAHAYIDDALRDGASVLVHCNQGVSRSATIVVSFLMRRLRLSASDALRRARAARACVRPNPGFMSALDAYDAELRSGKSAHAGDVDKATSSTESTTRDEGAGAGAGAADVLALGASAAADAAR